MSTAAAPAPEINSLADYRALREAGKVPLDKPVETKTPAEKTPAEAKPAADEPNTDDAQKDSTTAADEDAGGEESKQQEQIDKEARKRERLDKRFSKLTQERDEALRLLNEERARAGGGAPKPAEQAKPAAAAPADPNDPEPKLESYAAGDYLKWQQDWNRWSIRAELRNVRAQEEQRRAAETQKAAATAWDVKQNKARESHEDYDEVALDRNLAITPVMGQAITDAENGAEILYHLGEHPKEAARIAGLSAIAQVREIGKLELKLTSLPAEDKAAPAEKPISQAPKPVKGLQGAAAQSAAVKNLEGMTQAEYRKYRESGQIK